MLTLVSSLSAALWLGLLTCLKAFNIQYYLLMTQKHLYLPTLCPSTTM